MFKTGNERNVFGYSSEEYDRIVDDLSMTSSKDKAIYCESYLLKNAVVLPLSYENTIFAVAKGTTGVYSAGDSSNIYFSTQKCSVNSFTKHFLLSIIFYKFTT